MNLLVLIFADSLPFFVKPASGSSSKLKNSFNNKISWLITLFIFSKRFFGFVYKYFPVNYNNSQLINLYTKSSKDCIPAFVSALYDLTLNLFLKCKPEILFHQNKPNKYSLFRL